MSEGKVPITIREAVSSDLPALYELYGQLESPLVRLSSGRLAEVFSRLRTYPDYRVYVAESNGRSVGTYALMIMETLGARCAPSGIVEDVVVDRSSRGKGIGRAMMRHAMQHCADAGCYKLVVSSNLLRTDAHRFYESLGFQRHGVSFVVSLE